MTSFNLTGKALWQRMERAVEKIQQRVEKTATTLEQAGIPYAIIDGNAVRAWVAQVDEAAVRTTRDVDILLRRSDWPAAVAAMERAGFVSRHVKGIDMFLDGADSKARDAVHVVFAGEKVRPDDPVPAPDVSEAEEVLRHRILRLDALVRMKLAAFRDKDRMHLRDMIDVELVDESWCGRLPPELATRLKELIDNPNGWGAFRCPLCATGPAYSRRSNSAFCAFVSNVSRSGAAAGDTSNGRQRARGTGNGKMSFWFPRRFFPRASLRTNAAYSLYSHKAWGEASGPEWKTVWSIVMAKFLCIYREPTENRAKPSPEEMQALQTAWYAWMQKFSSAILPGGDGLKRTGRLLKGGLVTDGPYAETKEIIASFGVIQADNYEAALAVVRESPAAATGTGWSIEIREMYGFA